MVWSTPAETVTASSTVTVVVAVAMHPALSIVSSAVYVPAAGNVNVLSPAVFASSTASLSKSHENTSPASTPVEASVRVVAEPTQTTSAEIEGEAAEQIVNATVSGRLHRLPWPAVRILKVCAPAASALLFIE